MTGRRRFLSSAAWVAFVTAAGSRAGADDEASKLLEEVQEARRGVRTMVASFEQIRRIGLLSTDVTSRGRMVLVRPDRLRWELLPPDSVTYWVGPEGLSYATGTARARTDRATAGPMGRVLDDLLTFLGGDLRSLQARYVLNAWRAEHGVRIQAQPRDPALGKILRRLEIVLAQDRVTPVRVVVLETDKDFVRIRFSKVELNVDVEPSAMRP